ncbi:MAG: hypothetical protein DCF12_08465 [Snowella sp.]|nr:MAG: hypothetical protein DCF12_08465 [Snowella sp.]
MNDFRFRTEDIASDELQSLFVETQLDRKIIDSLKLRNPIILEGSRGTGKSFLLRMAEKELNDEFSTNRVLPVYITFTGGALISIEDDPYKFSKWMIANICHYFLRALKKKGLHIGHSEVTNLLSGNQENSEILEKKFESIHKAYDNFYASDSVIDSSEVPTINNFKDAVEEICQELQIKRVCFFFDEAAHILIQELQRQFFSLFRDLRSPYINCKAAVYPGVTFYGDSFEMTHDATLLRIEREITNSEDYLSSMKELVFKQIDEPLKNKINARMKEFNILAYSASGNPRILLNTIEKCGNFKSKALLNKK